MSVVRRQDGAAPRPAPDEGWSTYLDPDERMLWEGRPATGVKFRKSDGIMIPFSIAWCGITIAWELAALWTSGSIVFALVGMPFFVLGLYMMIGRFFWNAYERSHTRYALTDRRALVATSHWGHTLRSIPIGRSTDVEYRPGPEASIIFKRETQDTAKDSPATDFGFTENGFEFIQDGDTVYGFIRKIQAGDYDQDRSSE